jgi:hypothetical protein
MKSTIASMEVVGKGLAVVEVIPLAAEGSGSGVIRK